MGAFKLGAWEAPPPTQEVGMNDPNHTTFYFTKIKT